jgi:hypothetical protein
MLPEVQYQLWSFQLSPITSLSWPLNDLHSYMQIHFKNILGINFKYGNNKKIYYILKTCYVISVSFSTKCHLFHNFIYGFISVIYVFLLLCLCILILCLCMATLTEVFLCFFLSCKANGRVKPAKMEHGLHSSQFLCRSMCCLCVYVYCTTVTGWLSNCS